MTNQYLIRLLANFHVAISVLAFSILILAATQAILLALQNYLLRNKTITGIRFLPSIETMETRLFQIIALGFILLSLSLASAWSIVDEFYTASNLHKILLSSMAWIFFAVLLIGRKHAGWRGNIAIRWTLMSVITLLVAYFSSKLILLTYWK